MKKIVFAILFCLCAILTASVYANTQSIIAKNVVRLHIIANSNSKEDQAVKLLVRDAVLEAFSDYTKTASKTDAEEKIKNDLALAENTACRVLRENGFTYNVHAEFAVSDFPVRTYGTRTLPAGKYSGLCIYLGEGIGQNWWCVMYPPLCFTEQTYAKTESASDDITFEVKFKIAEVIQNLKSSL